MKQTKKNTFQWFESVLRYENKITKGTDFTAVKIKQHRD